MHSGFTPDRWPDATSEANYPTADRFASLRLQRREDFARQFAQHDRWLFSYLVVLPGNPADAEEVFQEVCVVLWRKHEEFQFSHELRVGTHFLALTGRGGGERDRLLRRVTTRPVPSRETAAGLAGGGYFPQFNVVSDVCLLLLGEIYATMVG